MRFLITLVLTFSALINQTHATAVLQMNLADMTPRAEKIFRGTLMDVTSSVVRVGGGEISALTYTFKVKELFKGKVDTVKGVSSVQVKMIGTLDKLRAKKRIIPGFPMYSVDKDYLMFVAPSGNAGLTTTMGLGQGSFRILGLGKQEMAVNDFDNVNLGQASTGQPKAIQSHHSGKAIKSAGPMPYRELANQIKSLLKN